MISGLYNLLYVLLSVCDYHDPYSIQVQKDSKCLTSPMTNVFIALAISAVLWEAAKVNKKESNGSG